MWEGNRYGSKENSSMDVLVLMEGKVWNPDGAKKIEYKGSDKKNKECNRRG